MDTSGNRVTLVDSANMECTLSLVPPTAQAGPPARADTGVLPVWTVSQNPSTASVTEEMSSRPPATLGDGVAVAAPAYTLIRPIGSGGMGEVWAATQSSLDRVVAVKRLKPRPLTEHSLESLEFRRSSFRQEARVAASLEHPNILPVHDLGRDEDGGPLLAMKLVTGRPWSDLIERDFPTLGDDDFLAVHIPILTSMAQAVAFAHSRGIVHRDLKPSQMMVGEFGEALLTDWGLAIRWKDQPVAMPQVQDLAMGAPLPTPATASNPAGTPALMAPEQTLAHARDVGPWTDVFLLGATLYFLLTGRFPFTAETSAKSMLLAREGRFPTPRERAPGRHIPADLEALCLEATRTNPKDRLTSAEAFRQRLEAHTRGTARRAKSRELSGAVAAQLPAPALSYADLSRLIAQLDEARQLWPDNSQVEPLRQATLERSAREALKSGDLALARFQAEALGDAPSAPALLAQVAVETTRLAQRKTLLRIATASAIILLAVIALGSAAFVARLHQEQRATLAQRDRAQAAEQVATRRATEAERNLAIAASQGEGAFALVDFILRDLKTALDEELEGAPGLPADRANKIAHEIAGRVARPIVQYYTTRDDSQWPDSLRLLQAQRQLDTADRFERLGRFAEALSLTTPTLALRRALLPARNEGIAMASMMAGGMLSQLAQYAEAEALLLDALSTFEALEGAESVNVATACTHLARLYERVNNLPKALELGERALRIRIERLGPIHPDVALAQSAVAGTLGSMGRYREARDLFTKSNAVMEATLGPDHSNVAASLANIAAYNQLLGQPDVALEQYKRSYAILLRTLGPKHPRVAAALNNIAYLHEMRFEYDQALELYREALDITKLNVGLNHPDAASMLNNIGVVLMAIGRADEARATHLQALEVRRAVLGNDHPDTASSLHNIALTLCPGTRCEEALDYALEALAICERTLQAPHPFIANCQILVSRILSQIQRHDEALAYALKAKESRAGFFGPEHPATAEALYQLGENMIRAGKPDEAVVHLRQAYAIVTNVMGPDKGPSINCRESLLTALVFLFARSGGLESPNESAVQLATEAVAVLEAPGVAPSKFPETTVFHAHCLIVLGRKDDARKLLEKLRADGYTGDAKNQFNDTLWRTLEARFATAGNGAAGS